jgi:hypothetical protein
MYILYAVHCKSQRIHSETYVLELLHACSLNRRPRSQWCGARNSPLRATPEHIATIHLALRSRVRVHEVHQHLLHQENAAM